MRDELFLYKGPYQWKFNARDIHKDQQVTINWLKALPPEGGTKHQRAYLLKGMKQFLEAKILQPARKARPGVAPGTVVGWYLGLRALVHWMVANDYWRFSQLSVDDLLAFIKSRKARHGSGRPSERSLLFHRNMFEDLWEYRGSYVGALKVNVRAFDAEFKRVCHGKASTPWKPVDEEAALPLIFDSIEWIERYGPFFVSIASEIYDARKKMVGISSGAQAKQLRDLYQRVLARDPFPEIANKLGIQRLDTHALARAFSVTQGAALNVLLFLVGLRVSEVVRLDVDCMDDGREDEYGQVIPYIKGIAAKRDSESRKWVAGPPLAAVVKFIKDLFQPVRAAGKCDALFLARTSAAPVPLPGRRIARMGSMTPVTLMSAFANASFRSSRPQIVGLHPHRARKTFARFVVKRDKRSLEALSFHFGHAYVAFTDRAYVGCDIELESLVGEEDRQELGRALSVLLQAPNMAGRGVAAISNFKKANTRFHGKLALQSSVEKLIKQGVHIAPCDWGYCLYTPSLSACGGDDRRPNEMNRSPEVCVGCSNFIVTQEHMHWWNDRAAREEAFLRDGNIPEQARAVAEQRLRSSRRILTELVAPSFKAKD